MNITKSNTIQEKWGDQDDLKLQVLLPATDWLDWAAPSNACLYSTALLDANHDPSKEKPLSTRTGRNITVRCLFNVGGSWKFFCKNQCEEKDILSKTHGDTAQRGRYRIKYLSFPAYGYLYVTIAQLTTSDSGRYWCGVDKSYLGFDIIVTEGEFYKLPHPLNNSSNFIFFYGKQSRYSQGWIPNRSSHTTLQTETIKRIIRPLRFTIHIFMCMSYDNLIKCVYVYTADSTMLYAGVPLLITALLLPVVVLIFCRWGPCKPKDEQMWTSKSELLLLGLCSHYIILKYFYLIGFF